MLRGTSITGMVQRVEAYEVRRDGGLWAWKAETPIPQMEPSYSLVLFDLQSRASLEVFCWVLSYIVNALYYVICILIKNLPV